jgi:hypothetical protein
MKQTVTLNQFRDAFRHCGRGEQFSYKALNALYDYLEEVGDETGQEYDLDVIALCCEYAEYGDLEEFREDYDADIYQTMEDIENVTTVIPIPKSDGFIIAEF